MKAAVLFAVNQPLRVVDLPTPRPDAGQVLVRLAASGICHTQLLEISGTNATGDHTPNLLGHEGSGVVIEIGQGVSKVKPGDHVVLSWIGGSGARSLPQPVPWEGGRIGRGWVTTFNELTLASESHVTPIPKEMPLLEAALVGCAMATGAGAVLNNAQIRAGQSVLVLGVGGIGVNMVHAAAMAGAAPIIAVDLKPAKIELARSFGATHGLPYDRDKLGPAVREIAGKDGVDAAFETVGRKETMEFAYDIVKKTSGQAILCGVPQPPGTRIEIDPFPLYYGRRLKGTGGGETNPDRDFPRFCQWFLEKRYDLSRMISHTVSLDRINEGIALLRSGEACRVVVDLREPLTGGRERPII